MSFPKKVFRWLVTTANWPYLGGSRKVMGVCPRCQAEISAEAKICAKCGEPLPGREPTFQNDPLFLGIRLVALAVFLAIIVFLVTRV